jgi:hypothetical protein
MAKIPEIRETKKLSLDFIAGLISGEGSFLVVPYRKGKQIVFVFQLRLHYNDRNLVFAVRNSLGLKEPVYEYFYNNRHFALLLVRKRSVIENVIIPAFEGRLFGLKERQFQNWKERFFEEKKKWRYRYGQSAYLSERFSPLDPHISSNSSFSDEEIKKLMIGTGEL